MAFIRAINAMTTARNSLPAQKSAARMAAVQALYLIEITGKPADKVAADFLSGHIPEEAGTPVGDFDRELFITIMRDATRRHEEIDEALKASLDPKWPLERLEKILRALLRAATAELFGPVDAPIVINDYINVAHGFFAGKEPALVNAVLDKIGKRVKA